MPSNRFDGDFPSFLFFAEKNLTKILYTGSLPFLPALSRENPERTTASMVDDPYGGVPAAHNNADSEINTKRYW